MIDHDSSYKLLFSHPEMVRDLLVGFVHEPWVADLDFSTLEKVSGGYVGDDLRDREDDIIWKVRVGGLWLYIYILLEFQSTVDEFMSLRMADYVISLYQDLRKSGQVTDKKLPPVLPLVLYHGEKRWHAPLEMTEMIVPLPGMAAYCPRMRYLLLDAGALSATELLPLRNLAGALFQLEQSRSVAALREVVRLLVAWLRTPEQASLRRAFAVWLRRVLLPKRLAGAVIPEMTDIYEVDTMLAERVQEWTKQWREEGWLLGRQEGFQEGLQEGKTALLLHLLQRRFGPVPEWVRVKVTSADLETLDLWTDNILDADSLQGIFQ
ncbi:MAG: Rpn family recombination-promoting nuclease/putative transposase [Magnetococcus sp. XQGC-1]